MEKTQNKQGGVGGQDGSSNIFNKISESLDTAEKTIKETETWLSEQKKTRALIEKDRGQEQPGGRGGGLGIGKAIEALDGKEKEGRDM
ncbi:MAG: hypothetical protein A4E60_01953 [Syntrophorhabdus sp. PtaB.Bin047]|nr:MAG: hypothetical protein A4E60_01953 [Syntrophorhabdus sp. PtaB.Bin047]